MMQELSKAIIKNTVEVAPEDWQDAMEKWAIYCLRNHSEPLLSAGLEVSKAMAQYAHELHQCLHDELK